MKISESAEFKIDLKTVVSLVVITSMFVGMYYSLQADIDQNELDSDSTILAEQNRALAAESSLQADIVNKTIKKR